MAYGLAGLRHSVIVIFEVIDMNNIIDEYNDNATILDSLQEDYADLDSLMFNDDRFDDTEQYSDWSL